MREPGHRPPQEKEQEGRAITPHPVWGSERLLTARQALFGWVGIAETGCG